jgi:hypothetical protein
MAISEPPHKLLAQEKTEMVANAMEILGLSIRHAIVETRLESPRCPDGDLGEHPISLAIEWRRPVVRMPDRLVPVRARFDHRGRHYPAGLAWEEGEVVLSLGMSCPWRRGYDLWLASLGNGVGMLKTAIPPLVAIGIDGNGQIQIRVFDDRGEPVDEHSRRVLPAIAMSEHTTDREWLAWLTSQAEAVAALKRRLPGLMPPHVLTDAEKERVLVEATAIASKAWRAGDTPRPHHLVVGQGTNRMSWTSYPVLWPAEQELESEALPDPCPVCARSRANPVARTEWHCLLCHRVSPRLVKVFPGVDDKAPRRPWTAW